MKELHFGTAGIPLSTPAPITTQSGIAHVHTLSLNAMELEFVQSVNISLEKAPLVKKTAQENNVTLTCHAPYFINLNSKELYKQKESRARILNAARAADACGAYSVCFHPGFYQGQPKDQSYSTVKKNLKKVLEEVRAQNLKLWIRPEITGKHSQFGDLNELLQLSSELDQVLPCIDFSHLHARANGKKNSYKDFHSILSQMEKTLGKNSLQELHAHVQGVNYSEKGERNHLPFDQSDFNYKELLRAFKDFNCKGVIICESPVMEEDALKLMAAFEQLK